VIQERVYEPFADLYSVVIFHCVFVLFQVLYLSQNYVFQ
jgi:hypothetical protein